jgi:flagellar basal body P-ring protein FlgI
MRTALCTLLLLTAVSGTAQAARIKDLAVVRGVRSNPLVGFGVVIGLSGHRRHTASDGDQPSDRFLAPPPRRQHPG